MTTANPVRAGATVRAGGGETRRNDREAGVHRLHDIRVAGHHGACVDGHIRATGAAVGADRLDRATHVAPRVIRLAR